MTINIADENKDVEVTPDEYWEHFPLALYALCVKVITTIAIILILISIIDLVGIVTAYFVDYELYIAPFTILNVIGLFGLGIGSLSVIGGTIFTVGFGLLKCYRSINEHIRLAVIANRTYQLVAVPV